MSRGSSSNTSRAYWELRAEQVMDRVFQGGPANPAVVSPPNLEPIEVQVQDSKAPATLARLKPQWLALGALLLIGVGTTAGLWGAWQSSQRDLRQERNLRLLEGIRKLGTPGSQSQEPALSAIGSATLPPPPEEAWIEQLPPLSVPLHGTLPAQSAPPVSPTTAGASEGSDQPVLLGVVQIPGKPGSAIFQIGSSSSNALVGESIGSSGWKLISAQGDTAVIERGGQRRRVNISSGL
ncbi:MAG: hypothetical protein ACO23M_10450 [Vulcanococcus sp.]